MPTETILPVAATIQENSADLLNFIEANAAAIQEQANKAAINSMGGPEFRSCRTEDAARLIGRAEALKALLPIARRLLS